MDAVCVLVPVLGRPDNVAPTMHTVAAHTAAPYRLLFIATDTDQRELAALEAHGADYITIDEPGTYARKINLGARASTEPWVFLAADDLAFHAGWYEAAMTVAGPNVKVIGTNDLGNRRTILGEHSTHTLVHRSYINDPGAVVDEGGGSVLCEAYPHEYCDDELIETSKFRLVYAHAYQAHVEHLHYLWGKGEDDNTYRLGRQRSALSRNTFRRRRHLWR